MTKKHRSYSQRLRSYACPTIPVNALLRTARAKQRYATLHQLAGDVNLAAYRWLCKDSCCHSPSRPACCSLQCRSIGSSSARAREVEAPDRLHGAGDSRTYSSSERLLSWTVSLHFQLHSMQIRLMSTVCS